MSVIEPSVQPFIPRQFPSIYRDEDPNFIAFMREYYRWLEQTGKPLYYARNFLELIDVDTTSDEILVFIKEKYLKNIQFDTEANIRAIIKHCLDIYRSKGTQRCLDLLFRLVFNEVATFYYPKDDIFMLSDGTWRVPFYLELSYSASNIKLYNKIIRGSESQATAFVDDVIRRTVKGRMLDIIYISAITGQFKTNEVIQPVDASLDIAVCPTIIGSLSSVIVDEIGTGQGWEIGDLVNISSIYGEQGKALVANVITQPSVIIMTPNNGGYGYTASANVIASKQVLVLSNVNITNTYSRFLAYPFETITQGANSATVVGVSSVTLVVSNINGSFIKGETITQHNSKWTYDTATIGQAAIKTISFANTFALQNVFGVFWTGNTIIGETSKATATVSSISMAIGITDMTGTFDANTSISTPNFNAIVSVVGLTSNVDAEIATTLLYPEVVQVNTDRLADWTANLNAVYTNFTANNTCTITDPIKSFLTMANATIGKIDTLIPLSVNYQVDYPPITIVSEPYVKDMNIRDKALGFTGATATFAIGELVSQPATGARGLVQSISNDQMNIQELRFYPSQNFVITSNATTKIYGGKTGTTANVISVSEQEMVYPAGLNADIWTRSAAFVGSITELKIVDAGFGYIDNELVEITSNDIVDSNSGYGYTRLTTGGKSRGFYEQKGGFLSDQKKLFDGYYYQNYSYEISSSKTPNKYQDMVKKIGHVAGTIMFSRYVYNRNVTSAITQNTMEIVQS